MLAILPASILSVALNTLRTKATFPALHPSATLHTRTRTHTHMHTHTHTHTHKHTHTHTQTHTHTHKHTHTHTHTDRHTIMLATCLTSLTPPTCRYVDVRSISGFTPLHYCVAGRHVDAVRTLLSFEPNLTAQNECNS